MIKRILQVGNKEDEAILHAIAENVPTDIILSDEIQGVIDDMIDTLESTNGLGIAANQIGSNWKIFVIVKAEAEQGQYDVFINPVIVVKSGQTQSYAEGCLSVPGKRYNLKRASEVKLRALDREGRVVGFKTRTKMKAFEIQHEMDHLNGILICDKGGEEA